nr:GAF domain-containing protein [Anaerolineae bacterium]
MPVRKQVVQKVRELEISHSIGKLITSLLDLDELLTRIVEASVDITGAEEGYLLLVDEGTGELYLRAGQNLTEEHAQGFRVKVHDSIAGSVVKTGKPEIAESKEGKSLKIKTGYQVKALLNVPLKVREKVIGVLGVNNKVSDKAFSEDNLHMLSVLADYAAIAIEKARLFSQLTEAKERLNGLIASSLNAVIAIDQGKKITLFNRRAEDMLGWTAKEMEGQSVARLHVDFGKAQEIHEVVNREGTIVGWEIVLKHKDGTRIPALLSATLIRDGQGNPIGQAGFIRDRRQVNLLEERLRAFVGVSQAIIGVLELDEVLDLIVKSAVAVFPAAQSGAIHLYDKRADILRVRANTHDYSVEAIEALSLRAGEGIAGWVFQNQQPLVVNDAGQDPRYKRIDHPEVQDHKSMICMPLRVKEKVIGAL